MQPAQHKPVQNRRRCHHYRHCPQLQCSLQEQFHCYYLPHSLHRPRSFQPHRQQQQGQQARCLRLLHLQVSQLPVMPSCLEATASEPEDSPSAIRNDASDHPALHQPRRMCPASLSLHLHLPFSHVRVFVLFLKVFLTVSFFFNGSETVPFLTGAPIVPIVSR